MKGLLTLAAVVGFMQSAERAASSSSVAAAGQPTKAVGFTSGAWDTEPLARISFEERTTQSSTSVVIPLDQALILIDPVGDQQQFRRFGRPDIVVLTSPDPKHLSIDTMIGLLRRDTLVLAPQSVIDKLPLMISNNTVAPFEIGTAQTARGITFSAVSPSARPPAGSLVHDREVGEIRVLIEVEGERVLF